MSPSAGPSDAAEGHFDDWSRADLLKYVDFMMRAYRVADAFWFLYVEEDHDSAEACRLNERVWAKASALAVRDLRKRFGLQDTGLKGFRAVLRLCPWSILTGYEIEERGDELVLRTPHCPPQEGRKRHGLGEYSCKAMHLAEFEAMAREVDPRIRVHCDFAPPDKHPDDVYCQWRFTLAP